MTGAVGDALPWPRANNNERANNERANNEEHARISETTPGEKEGARWVVVATNLNPGEAMIIKSRLESEHIPALVQQEAVGSVLGLTVGPLGSAKVLVPELLAEQALDILAETFENDGSETWEDDAARAGDEF